MLLSTTLAIIACVPAALGKTVARAAAPDKFVAPSLSPRLGNSTNYVGASNGTLENSPVVPGKKFDRNIIVMLENTNYEEAAASPFFQKLASRGILHNDYYGVIHPSQGNYVAAVSGSTQGQTFDDSDDEGYPNSPASVRTIVDLLEAQNISWAAYMENMPELGFTGLDYRSHNYHEEGGSDYNYYVRKHSGLMKFDSIVDNPRRLARHRNFNNFAEDLAADALPQWTWITPNNRNNAHDTGVEYGIAWLEFWLVPLLEDPNFNNNRTLITLTWDESEEQTNQIYVLSLGQVVPEPLHNTTDSTYYTHYSQLSTVEANWDLGNLGQGDVHANVYEFLAQGLGHENTDEKPVAPVGLGPYLVPTPPNTISQV